MEKILNTILSFIVASILIGGCATVNKGLDKANDGAKKVGKPVGKVINIPSSFAEGAAGSMIKTKNRGKDNPFDR